MTAIREARHLTIRGSFLIKLLSLLLVLVLLLSDCSDKTSNGESGYVTAVPDSAITLAVENHLQGNPQFSAKNIQVQTRDGIVTLSGTINNLLSKKEALRITRFRGIHTLTLHR